MVKRDFLKLLLPAVVAGEFYAPDTRGYKELSDAVTGCEESDGTISRADEAGLQNYIKSHKNLSRKDYLILVDDNDEPDWYNSSDLTKKKGKRPKKAPAVCSKADAVCDGTGELQNSYERYQFYPAPTKEDFATSKNYTAARESCQSLGDNWDLMIINTKREWTFLKEVMDDSCWDHEAWWIGFKEYDTVAPGQRGSLTTVFGKEPEWEPKWETDEPNDAQGVEECIRYRLGDFNDAPCSKYWSGVKRDEIGMGYVCEKHNYIESCEPVAVDSEFMENYSIHEPKNVGEGKSWDDARAFCQAKGANWDLAVPNTEAEFDKLVQATQCSWSRFWLGTKYTAYTDEVAVDYGLYYAVDGSDEAQIFRRWDKHTNWESPDPNNKPGVTECIRMRGDLMNDNDCSVSGKDKPHGWICELSEPEDPCEPTMSLVGDRYAILNTLGDSRNKRAACSAVGDGWGVYEDSSDYVTALLAANGYSGDKQPAAVCERAVPCANQDGATFTAVDEDDLKIIGLGNYNKASAKAACKNYGSGWNLAIINDEQESKEINRKLGGCYNYWIGMTHSESIVYDEVSSMIGFAPWAPINTQKICGSGCVTMRGGEYYSADCDAEIESAVVCEYTPPVENKKDEDCLPCKHNALIRPWHSIPGCSNPVDTCEESARLQIVDQWKIGNGQSRPVRYGFVGLIKIPQSVIDSKQQFSVLIRFSPKVNHGHFQLWNMNFWNFYNGGYEVLIHSKTWNTDLHDKTSIAFVAEGLNVNDIPELLFWRSHQRRHQCFQPSMHHGQRTGADQPKSAFELAIENHGGDISNVSRVRFNKKGKVIFKGARD